jgi:hypothetical protein
MPSKKRTQIVSPLAFGPRNEFPPQPTGMVLALLPNSAVANLVVYLRLLIRTALYVGLFEKRKIQ